MGNLYRTWDIQSAVMTLSSFRAQPRKGHLERIKRIYGFLCRFRHFKLRFRVDEPDYSGIPKMQDYDWEHSVYGNPTEDIPTDKTGYVIMVEQGLVRLKSVIRGIEFLISIPQK